MTYTKNVYRVCALVVFCLSGKNYWLHDRSEYMIEGRDRDIKSEDFTITIDYLLL